MGSTEWRGRIRRLRPGEAAGPVQCVFDGLSARSRYQRFHTEMPRLTASQRAALATVDGDRRAVLVAEHPHHGGWTAVGIGRLMALDDGRAEIALEVVDAAQGRGVGRRLLAGLVATAHASGRRRLVAVVLASNPWVLDWLRREFAACTVRADGPASIVDIALRVRSTVDRAA
jgi:GNAT superfamily N-acetyltransferase